MALVADYSSCSESENEEEISPKEVGKGEKEKLSNGVDDSEIVDDIVDEDEDHRPAAASGTLQNNSATDGAWSILDETTEDIPGEKNIFENFSDLFLKLIINT